MESGNKNKDRFGNQSSAHQYGNPSDPNDRNAAKFESDNDDFHRPEDNMDGEMNLTNAGFTGCENSSDLSRDSRGAFSTDAMHPQDQSASSLNDHARGQITNDQEAHNSLNL